jgi:chromosome partitioning protein
MTIIGIISGKGGVGKTTTSVSLAAAFARYIGRKTLLVDCDPQGGASYACGIDPGALLPDRTVLGFLQGHTLPDVAQVMVAEGFGLLAAPPGLGPAYEGSRDRNLFHALRSSSAEVIILDSAPGFGTLPQAVVSVADKLLVTAVAEPLAVRGLAQSIGLLTALESSEKLIGCVLTMVSPRLALTADQRDEIAKLTPIIAEIPRAVVVAESSLAARSVLAYAPKACASESYRVLAKALAL